MKRWVCDRHGRRVWIFPAHRELRCAATEAPRCVAAHARLQCFLFTYVCKRFTMVAGMHLYFSKYVSEYFPKPQNYISKMRKYPNAALALVFLSNLPCFRKHGGIKFQPAAGFFNYSTHFWRFQHFEILKNRLRAISETRNRGIFEKYKWYQSCLFRRRISTFFTTDDQSRRFYYFFKIGVEIQSYRY